MASVSSHVSQVRALYKALLKLHRGLPLQMQALGDQYVKEEFRAHKSADQEQVAVFMREWTNYYLVLAKQLGQRRKTPNVGQALSPEMLENFQDDQIGQLHELFKETTSFGSENKSES